MHFTLTTSSFTSFIILLIFLSPLIACKQAFVELQVLGRQGVALIQKKKKKQGQGVAHYRSNTDFSPMIKHLSSVLWANCISRLVWNEDRSFHRSLSFNKREDIIQLQCPTWSKMDGFFGPTNLSNERKAKRTYCLN